MTHVHRIEFPNALYHVTSRGDRRELIFADPQDRQRLLGIVAAAMKRFDARLLAFCLMSNHYHFVLQTRRANLSQVMRQLNGVYTQAFNRRHGLVGHLFQARFHAILVDREAYLLALCRYVEMNPVRAGFVRHPSAWRWSSYRSHAGLSASPEWLDTTTLHEHLLGRDVVSSDDTRTAADLYAELVTEERHVRLWDDALRERLYLGDAAFVDRMQAMAVSVNAGRTEAASRPRPLPAALSTWLADPGARAESLRKAHVVGGFTMTDIARHVGLSVSRVSRLIREAECEGQVGSP